MTTANSSIEFFVPGSEVGLEDISNWQLYNPDLREVIVICDTIEKPISLLHTAVIANFQACVAHKFFVSPNDFEQSAQDNLGYFHTLYNVARDSPEIPGAIKKLKSIPFKELFHIEALPEPWAKAPYIFYRCETKDGIVTRALRGSGNVIGSGIAFRYLVVEPEDAHAIVTVLESSLSRAKVSVTMDELQNSSATVVPFPANRAGT